MEYQGNPKHKEPWQRGRRGSLCPPEVTGEVAKALLEKSVEVGRARFAAHEGRAYKAFRNPETDSWHGFPVAWQEVPDSIWRAWIHEGRIQRSDLRRYWKEAP